MMSSPTPDSSNNIVQADLAEHATRNQQNDDPNLASSNPSMQHNSDNIDQIKMRMMVMENKCAQLEMENVKLQKEMDNKQIQQLKREQQLERTAYENKCDLYEQMLENMKLRGIIERENDKKQIEELKRELLATKGNMEESAKKNNCAQLELREKLEQMNRKLVDVNEHVEQLKKENVENQKKLEEAIKRAEEGKIALQQHIDQLKRQMAELDGTTVRRWLPNNPKNNKWDATKTRATISENELVATRDVEERGPQAVFAALPFSFAFTFSFSFVNDQHINLGTKISYYEVKTGWNGTNVGFSADNNQHDGYVGRLANSYSIEANDIGSYRFSDTLKQFEWPAGANKPKINGGNGGNVLGCGLVVWPNGKRSIFFTVNGTLLGKHIPIPFDGSLYPAITFWSSRTVEANFGDNPAIPFVYDVTKCPGLYDGSEE